jgi:LacI family transcriptional regulator
MKNNKEITIYDIALKLDVSPSTVSRGLNNHPSVTKRTRKRVLDMAKLMGYRTNLFARNLQKQRTHTLGVIVPKLNSNFQSSVLAGIEKVANAAGYNLLISQSLETESKEVANAAIMFNSRVDGLIVSLAFDTKNFSHFEPFFERNIPVIFFDRVADGKLSTNVVIDNLKAGHDATSHLLGQGCKRVVHITGNLSRNVYSDRMKGYRQALAEHNIPFDGKYVISNNLDEKSAMEAAKQLLTMKPMPDGIFITNDNCAAICMQVLKDANYNIPGDIRIVGFNNDLITTLVEPKLTTINYPGQEMGEIVAHAIVNHLEGRAPMTATSTIIIKSELIVRESSLNNIK